MKTYQIEKIVNSFSKNWIGRNGVQGIGFSNDKDNKYIAVYADLNDLIYDKIPNNYKGLRTQIIPISKISALVK
jgi:hypothetical protein